MVSNKLHTEVMAKSQSDCQKNNLLNPNKNVSRIFSQAVPEMPIATAKPLNAEVGVRRQ